MSCTSPITAWQALDPGRDQKLIFAPTREFPTRKLAATCGKCLGCRGSRSMRRAVQIYCELQTTENRENCYFITFTYSDEKIPENYSLYKPHMTKAIKLIRKKQHEKMRYFQNGEYGLRTQRPHHHMAAFNMCLDDLELYREHPYKTYTSEKLSKCWPHGHVEINRLTIETCIYISQHDAKKILMDIPHHELTILDPETGEYINDRVKEYATSSNRPGIGYEYFRRYHDEIYNTDSIVINGTEFIVPLYFDNLLKEMDPERFEEVRLKRMQEAVIRTDEENEYQEKFNRVKYEQKKRDSI